MTKSLNDLMTELQEDVPAVAGVPSDAQYERAIKDAVLDFSRRCGLEKNTEFAIVSGTATYDLPTDFLSLIEMDDPCTTENGGLASQSGIIPLNSLRSFEEKVTIKNGQLTIYPTPSYSMTRYMEYKSAWILDDGNYPLTDDEARIVLLCAKKICFEKLVNVSAGGFKYAVGNMSVDISSESSDYSKRQYELHEEYVQACKDYNGAALC